MFSGICLGRFRPRLSSVSSAWSVFPTASPELMLVVSIDSCEFFKCDYAISILDLTSVCSLWPPFARFQAL